MKQFSRFIQLIGEEKFAALQSKKVLVIGIGGVGGYAVEALVRSGISHLTIVDYDTIDITNLNRQIISTYDSIGSKKVEAIKKRIQSIYPNCQLNILDLFLKEDNMEEIFRENFDYVIDACDTVNTKKMIITTCLKKKIKFISCMGTGNKFHPELLQITELKKTSYDKLAKVMRKWALDNHIKEKIMVVSSTEVCQKNHHSNVGSTSFVPGIAGMLCASYIINDMIQNN